MKFIDTSANRTPELATVEIQKETGATFLHPFDDVYVAAGQGTIGLEILEDLEDVDGVNET